MWRHRRNALKHWKMKVQYLMSLLFDLFEILQAVRSEQMISLDFKFRCYGNSKENN